MDSKGLNMPVSESDKMEASVLGCRLSEKVEHLPIKKRRFLFSTSSSEGTDSVAACVQSSSQDAVTKPDEKCPPAVSLTVADLHQTESKDSKLAVQKFVKYSRKTFGKEGINSVSVASHGTLQFKANNVKLESMSAKETDFPISTAPFKETETECTKMNQVTSNTQKSAALDDRLNWDLNTVMAWEEQLECDHNMNNRKEGRECGSVSENIGNEISPVKLKSLIPKIERSELPECKPVCNDFRKLLPPVISSAPLLSVDKINALHNQHANSSISDAVPSTLTLEYPVCDISAKRVNVKAAVTDFTFMPSGFGHGIDIRENVVSSKIVGSGSNVNQNIASVRTSENDKLSLSLVTVPSLENRVHQIGSACDEDNKANVKRVITSNGIAIGSMISRGTESSQNVLVSSKTVGSRNNVNQAMTALQTTENEKLNLSLVTAASTETVVHQSGSTFDDEDDKAKVKRVIMENPPAAVSSMHDVVCSHADVPSDIVSNNKEVCDYENYPSDMHAGSEVDNIDQVSFGYEDSQFEDGEFRESSIQTWEGNDGEDMDIEHGTTDNRGAYGTRGNNSLKSTDVGSQKGTDEISSVLLPEKLDSSDQISDSEPNVTQNCTTETNMKDASQSDQWKMNVPGSDLLPENRSSSSNINHTKAEVSRFYRRETSTRDAFLSRSRFLMQGSSSNADDSGSRSVRDSGVIRSVGRGKYKRGGGTWDRSPPFLSPSFRRSLPEDVDTLTDKVDPNVTRGSFRSRLMVNSEEDEFRARLGLRPAGDTCHNRFVNVGRGRSLRYGSRHNDVGPRERYYGHPANDEPSMDYSHSFPTRHRFTGSTSPPRSRARSPIGGGFRGRSRSPNLRPDARMRREPNYRHGFEPDHVGKYNLEPSRNNNSPPSSRFLKYKQRSFVFDRRSPPPLPSGDRLGFYESSRKTKQNENYRSARFTELHGGGRDGDVMDHGFRRGGFARPYDMGRPIKQIQYEEDGFGPPVFDSRDKEPLEFHGRGNPKPYRDLQRRVRDDRGKW